jgi:pimeloyl-ACP methyl ester carboxylesterase
MVATTPKFHRGSRLGTWRCDPAVLDDLHAADSPSTTAATVQSFLALQTRGDEHALDRHLRLLRSRLAVARRTGSGARSRIGLEVLRKHRPARRRCRASPYPALVIAGEHDRLTPPGGRPVRSPRQLPTGAVQAASSAAVTRRSFPIPTLCWPR